VNDAKEFSGSAKFITFEGGEGAGKSTQIKRLSRYLTERAIDHIQTREPGGSPGAEEIRKLLVEGEPDRWDAETEALLHFAARRDHLIKTVEPALTSGKWVLCDRFADSTSAYQGYGHGVSKEGLDHLYALVSNGRRPDLTIVLDMDVTAGLARAGSRADAGVSAQEDRYERMDIDFHERLRAGFLDIAAKEPDRCVVIDADREADTVFADVRDAVDERYLG